VRTGIFVQTLQSWAGRPIALSIAAGWDVGPLLVTGILRPRGGTRTLREWWIEPPRPVGAGMQPTPLRLEAMRRRYAVDPVTRQPLLLFWNGEGLAFELTLLRDMRYGAFATRPA
jgi:hypothetical protein